MVESSSDTDVLIIGAGAAGMMAALCAASYGMKARIIDKRSHSITAGHGDGIFARTMEILDTYGISERILEEGVPVMISRWYEPDQNGRLIRTGRSTTASWQPPSPFGTVSLTQATVQRIMEERIKNTSAIRVERGLIGEGLVVEEDNEYPICLIARRTTNMHPQNEMNNSRVDDNVDTLREARHAENSQETIRAKYVIGCDGAHSWTRQQVGISMLGDETEDIWGVIDIVPITDFPEPRIVNRITGHGFGLLWIPRERNLVRVYCLLHDAKKEGGKLVRSSATPDMIMKAINTVLHPYTLSYEVCEWWAAYQTTQRVAADNMDPTGRVFLAGDAVHTHSPQIGQGMNSAIGDIHNLMWKLNLVIKGAAGPGILKSYREERLVEGQRLVDFDRKWAAMAAGHQPPPALEGTKLVDVAPGKMGSAWSLILPGLHLIYPPGLFTKSTPQMVEDAKASVDDGQLPAGIVTGMRMPSFRVRRHSDLVLQWLGQAFQSNGRFRFVLFTGDVSKAAVVTRLADVCEKIKSLKIEKWIDVITVHISDPSTVNQLSLPDLCSPFHPRFGYDYDKVFSGNDITDKHGAHWGAAYEKYGVDREEGRLVLLRPDGYVAYQGELATFDPIRQYFKGLIITPGGEN